MDHLVFFLFPRPDQGEEVFEVLLSLPTYVQLTTIRVAFHLIECFHILVLWETVNRIMVL